jgi:hypothetical protein
MFRLREVIIRVILEHLKKIIYALNLPETIPNFLQNILKKTLFAFYQRGNRPEGQQTQHQMTWL